jgi:DNA helicase-2/ATP-dependent DNA helicase PcrA
MSGLNAAQRAAVEHGTGPLLILAGAGSGKTRVVTHRIARLVQGGVAPERILAVSFTNKAAAEMGERMLPLVGKAAARELWLSTFHSFGLRFVREERKALRLASRFVIFDQGDSLGVVKDVLREMRNAGAARKLDPSALLARVSSWKNQLLAPAAVPESDFEYDDVARELYPEYEARLRAMCALDFDDLVVQPVQLLARKPEVRARWQERFEHLLVDEFQDTSKVQLELCKLLCNAQGNVCVVGDDDQSIYGWRGADVSNILDFDAHFPGARIVKLEDNYRSRAAVLAVANAAIAQSSGKRHGKTLRAARGGGDKVRLCVCEDPTEEAQLVAREVRDLCKAGIRRDQIAVLYRSNLQARAIEEELSTEGIAYRLFGGTQFFDRREVKDVAAYLRVLLNPSDEISLRRIINQPPRGIGAKTVSDVQEHAEQSGSSFAQALQDPRAIGALGDAARRSIEAFNQMIDAHRAQLAGGNDLHAVARSLVDEAGIRKHLTEADAGGEGGESKAGAHRWGNVEHLFGWLERAARESGGKKRALQAFLERVTLNTGGDDDDEPKDAVTLSTLHGAKGLEFDYVFLIGCVEGQLPHNRTTDPKASEAVPTDVEEERRLFYVGVTRARDRLYITRARRRLLRGTRIELTPSRFLDGLPEEHVELYERPEKQELGTDEIAALGRAFLAQKRAQAQQAR